MYGYSKVENVPKVDDLQYPEAGEEGGRAPKSCLVWSVKRCRHFGHCLPFHRCQPTMTDHNRCTDLTSMYVFTDWHNVHMQLTLKLRPIFDPSDLDIPWHDDLNACVTQIRYSKHWKTFTEISLVFFFTETMHSRFGSETRVLKNEMHKNH